MAYTRIHAIKATVHKSVKYICNPAKTDGEILISSFACSPETVRFDFQFELSKTKNSGKTQAYHLIQSFAPGEVSYEEAHAIGIDLADRLLGGHHAYVVATHTDGEHPHNHIIFCAADHITHGKYNDCKASYRRIRTLSDELCAEHQLSVINPGPDRGKSYKEWLSVKQGTSWKAQIKKDIDDTIRLAKSYEMFLALMRAKGYEIKGETFGEGAHKYVTFKAPGMQRSARGSAKSLGSEYTKERIKERIEQRSRIRVTVPQKRPVTRMIDTGTERFQDAPGLKKWADMQNLKLAASNYAEVKNLAALSEQIDTKRAEVKEARSTVVRLDRQMKQLSEIIRYAEQYTENRKYHLRHKKSKNPERYFQEHEGNLLLYSGAVNVLQKYSVSLKGLDPEKLHAQYAALEAERARVNKTYKTTEREIKELTLKYDNLKKFLSIDNTADRQSVNQDVKKSL